MNRLSWMLALAASLLLATEQASAGASPSPKHAARAAPAGKPGARSKQYEQALANHRKRPVHQIINGAPAARGEFPWQVSLQVSTIDDPLEAHYCGGSIYAQSWIITAAHCVHGLNATDLLVGVGAIELKPGLKRVKVDRIIRHPGYKVPPGQEPDREADDLALLHLKTPLQFGSQVAPIALLSQADEAGFVHRTTQFTVSGWGAEAEGGLAVQKLQKVPVPYADPAHCSAAVSYPPSHGKPQIVDGMLCAGSVEGDSCQGDSGGPLMLPSAAGPPRLAGVVSWGDGCAEAYKYGVYTRVSRYRQWISQTTGQP